MVAAELNTGHETIRPSKEGFSLVSSLRHRQFLSLHWNYNLAQKSGIGNETIHDVKIPCTGYIANVIWVCFPLDLKVSVYVTARPPLPNIIFVPH